MHLGVAAQAAGSHEETRRTALYQRFRAGACSSVILVMVLIVVLVLALVLVFVLVLVLLLLTVAAVVRILFRIRRLRLEAALSFVGQAVLTAMPVVMAAVAMAVTAFT